MGKLIPVRQVSEEPAALSDATLVAGIATGDPAALAALYRRHGTAVYRFVSRLAGVDSNDLDDLVQSTFLGVNQAASRFTGACTVKTWIFGIAIRVVGKHVRTEVRRRHKHANAVALAQDSPRQPDALVEQRVALERISAGLANLTHDLRAVFVLCVIEEVPGKDAASVLGIREGTLWRRLHEARTELRRAVEEP